VAVMEKYQMIPSMSRPANPYDNASCESFIKTLKREEIYANAYEDLDKTASVPIQFVSTEGFTPDRCAISVPYTSVPCAPKRAFSIPV
jgi:transposase InsO family protein